MQLARQLRQVDAALGDAAVEALAVLVEHRPARELGRGLLAVVGARVDAVAVGRVAEHAAGAGDGDREALVGVAVVLEDQAEDRARGIEVGVGTVGLLAGLAAFRPEHRADVLGDRERVPGVGGLLGAIAAQPGQGMADRRCQRRARRLEQVLGLLEDRVAGDAGAADLRHGIDEQAARGVGEAGVVVAERPRVVAMAQVAPRAGHGRRHQRFDAVLLEQVEDRALDRVGRRERGVQGRIRERQAQGEAVGGAAKRGEVVALEVGVQVRREQRQGAPAAVQAAAAEVQVGLAGDGADRCGAELLDLLLVARPCLHGARAGAGARRLDHRPAAWPSRRWSEPAA